MSRARMSWLLPALFLLSAGLAGLWLYKNLEFVDEEYDVEADKIVRENPLYAVSELLERHDYTMLLANDRALFKSLPEADNGIVWLRTLDTLVTEKEFRMLFSWVENGGHLIAGLNGQPDEGHLMRTYLEEADVSFHDYNLWYEQLENALLNDDTLQIKQSDVIDTATVALGYEPYLQSAASSRLRVGPNGGASLLLQKQHGAGWLTLYTEHRAFDNWRVAEHDNAYLLMKLLRASKGQTINFVLEPRELPGLLSTVWSKVPLVIVTLVIVLIGYLRLAAARLGPIESEPTPGGSNLLLHLRARGEFWRRHQHIDSMLTPLRHAALDVVKRRQGDTGNTGEDLGTLDDDTLFAKAADIADCSTHQARKALLSSIGSDAEIVSSSVVLYRLLHDTSKHHTNEAND